MKTELASVSDPSLGRLIGISAGPGDPELLTVKAVRLLAQSPVVAFPAGRGNQVGMAERILAPYLSDQVRLPLEFPFVQDLTVLRTAWQAAAAQVWPFLQQGQDVVFASEGDVSFFSTFTYLAQALQQQHPEVQVEAVPGVCSPLAAAAVLGIPLTVQTDRLAILPALYSVDDLKAVLGWAEVVVLMKVSSVYAQVWQVLQQLDLLHRSHVVTYATWDCQTVYRDLSHHRDLHLPYFSILLIQSPSNPLG